MNEKIKEFIYQDESGAVHITREGLLNDLDLLKRFYRIWGKDKVIGWILKKDFKIELPEKGSNERNT